MGLSCLDGVWTVRSQCLTNMARETCTHTQLSLSPWPEERELRRDSWIVDRYSTASFGLQPSQNPTITFARRSRSSCFQHSSILRGVETSSREAAERIGSGRQQTIGVCVCECVLVGEERERDGCVQSTQSN